MIRIFQIFIFCSLLFSWTVYGENKHTDVQLAALQQENQSETIGDTLQKQLVHLLASLKDCKSLLNQKIPRNNFSVIAGSQRVHLPVIQAKECLFQNVEQAGDKICESQKKLDKHFRMNVHYNEDQALDVIHHIQRIEEDYKSELFDGIFQAVSQLGHKPNPVIMNYLKKEVHPDYENLFDKKEYINCYFYFADYFEEQNTNSILNFDIGLDLKKIAVSFEKKVESFF